ncbi:MAG TPA: hypothetical protein PLN69_06290 [bacterium]|nr:hypothetical protein [bacterium]
MAGKSRIAMIGAGGATFGTLMSYEAMRADGLNGGTLALIDINEERLEVTRAAAERMNEQLGSGMTIESYTDTPRGIEGADFILLSVEVGRWKHWKEDLEIPRKYGSRQDMAENGGPGGLFHSLRTINLVLKICEVIEKHNPDAVLINVTNPLPRVNLAISRATKLNLLGDCPEFNLGMIRLARFLLMPPERIAARAWGLNHFSWINELVDADSGRDLYPVLDRHIKYFPFMHGKLVRKCYRDFGMYPVSSDSHIGEYLPSEGPSSRSVLPGWFPYQKFSEFECSLRVRASKSYGAGRLNLPLEKFPRAIEGSMKLVEALATGRQAPINAINVVNSGLYIPNLPEWAIVEVPARTENGELIPDSMPPVPEPLLGHMELQTRIQSLIADSVLNRDPELAVDALEIDPLSPPTREACKKTFDEIVRLQKYAMPF